MNSRPKVFHNKKQAKLDSTIVLIKISFLVEENSSVQEIKIRQVRKSQISPHCLVNKMALQDNIEKED